MAKYAEKLGRKMVYLALLIYYAAMSDEMPYYQKMTLLGALAYLVMPVDLIPDFLPGGYTDDFAALMAAYQLVKDNITDAVKAQALRKLQDWFPGPAPVV